MPIEIDKWKNFQSSMNFEMPPRMTFHIKKPSYFLEDPVLLLKFSNKKLDIQVKMTIPYANKSQQVHDSQK